MYFFFFSFDQQKHFRNFSLTSNTNQTTKKRNEPDESNRINYDAVGSLRTFFFFFLRMVTCEAKVLKKIFQPPHQCNVAFATVCFSIRKNQIQSLNTMQCLRCLFQLQTDTPFRLARRRTCHLQLSPQACRLDPTRKPADPRSLPVP